ncbi:hypothetical protein ACFE04_011309 [Oxalis oulophora]
MGQFNPSQNITHTPQVTSSMGVRKLKGVRQQVHELPYMRARPLRAVKSENPPRGGHSSTPRAAFSASNSQMRSRRLWLSSITPQTMSITPKPEGPNCRKCEQTVGKSSRPATEGRSQEKGRQPRHLMKESHRDQLPTVDREQRIGECGQLIGGGRRDMVLSGELMIDRSRSIDDWSREGESDIVSL